MPSPVRPSVCPSVTRVDQSKTFEVRITQPSPQSSSPMTLVSWRRTAPWNSNGKIGSGAPNTRGVWKTPFSATAGIVFRFTRRRCYRALTVALAGPSCLPLWSDATLHGLLSKSQFTASRRLCNDTFIRRRRQSQFIPETQLPQRDGASARHSRLTHWSRTSLNTAYNYKSHRFLFMMRRDRTHWRIVYLGFAQCRKGTTWKGISGWIDGRPQEGSSGNGKALIVGLATNSQKFFVQYVNFDVLESENV